MAAYAALVSLLNNIHAVTKHPQLSTSFDDKYIHPLVEKTNVLLEFIEGNTYGVGSKEVEDLERQITSAAYKAEDVIESHIVDQIYAAKDLIESNSVDEIHQDMEQLPTHLAGPLTDRSEESHDLQHIIESHIVDQICPAKDLTEPNIVDQIHEKRVRRPSLITFLLKCVGCHSSERSEDLQLTNEDMKQLSTHLAGPITEGNIYGGGIKEVQDLERQITSAAHKAEDVIESHIVDQIHVGKSEPNPACSLDLQQNFQDMEAIMERITEFKEKQEVTDEKSTHQAVAAGPLKEGGESGMVGLDAELNQLLDKLTGYQSNRHIISIVGMGGTGKTTLAKNVFENQLIKEKYQFRAWATISQQSNAHEVLSKLLSDQGELVDSAVDDLGLKLHKILFGRRYLIVLDDIWSVTVWNEVKHFFPDNNNAVGFF